MYAPRDIHIHCIPTHACTVIPNNLPSFLLSAMSRSTTLHTILTRYIQQAYGQDQDNLEDKSILQYGESSFDVICSVLIFSVIHDVVISPFVLCDATYRRMLNSSCAQDTPPNTERIQQKF